MKVIKKKYEFLLGFIYEFGNNLIYESYKKLNELM
jgi:hypothetical protein